MKYTSTINNLIKGRVLCQDQLCKKTWHSTKSYELCHQNNDVRYNRAFKLIKQWPGGTVEEWVQSKIPLYWNVKKKEYWIDYGDHKNKISVIFKDLFAENPGLAYEYKMFHCAEADHYPIPRSKGGQKKFDNVELVSKFANVSSQDLDQSMIVDAYELAGATYKKLQEKQEFLAS